ncbi:MAG: AMP-binding protein [Myxococcales bacterium]
MDGSIGGAAWTAPPAETIAGALRAAASDDRPWLTFHRGESARALSFAGAFALARRWCAALLDAGVKAGDRVAVIQPNGPDFAGAFFGTQLAGATPVPLAWPVVAAAGERNYLLLAAQVARAEAVAVATQPDFAATAATFGLPLVTAPAATAKDGAAVGPHDAAFLQFTSGTTGAPRGAVISHRAAVASAHAMSLALDLGESDVGVSWLPLFHDMGLVGVLLCSLMRRFPIHLLSPAEFLLRPSRWLELLERTAATLTVAPNFGYELATRRVRGDFDLSRLRRALDGSEPVHRATIDGFERRFAARPGTILPVYGLAENTLGVCFADDPAPDLDFEGRAVPSVGRPLPGMEVKLIGGEIAVRGPSLMDGYFRDPDATAAALRDGWLRTGDLGAIRHGRLYVTGREKDLVIKNGRKFHPYDIERVAAAAVDSPPGGVAAFSVPNPATGTEDLVVVAELRRRTGDEQAVRTIRGVLLEELGVRPERVRLVGPGALPRTTSGKLRRRACAELFGGPEA